MGNRFEAQDFHRSVRNVHAPDFINREIRTANLHSQLEAMNGSRGGLPKEFGNLTLVTQSQNYGERQHHNRNWMRSSLPTEAAYPHSDRIRVQQNWHELLSKVVA